MENISHFGKINVLTICTDLTIIQILGPKSEYIIFFFENLFLLIQK